MMNMESIYNDNLGDQAVQDFQGYLRINTSHPNPKYQEAWIFLQSLASRYSLPFHMVQVEGGRQVLVVTLQGKGEEEHTAVLFNSHCDVVSADPSQWLHHPFEGIKDENGFIYGRGAQDCKCLFIQHLHSAHHILQSGVPLKRTIYITCVPDEEIGGLNGMAAFIKTQFFRDMNVGIVFDEGMASPTNTYSIFNGERTAWFVQATSSGPSGHSSQDHPNPAPANLVHFSHLLLSHPMPSSSSPYSHSSHSCHFHSPSPSPSSTPLGERLTVNLTVLQGGITNDNGNTFSYNTVPPTSKAIFDIRIPPSHKRETIKKMLDDCVEGAGGGVEYGLMNTNYTPNNHPISPMTECDEWWWGYMRRMCEEEGWEAITSIFPASSDARFLRNIGLPAIGFSPMNNTPNLFHCNNECLHVDVFKKGIDVFIRLMQTMGNL